MYGQSVWDSWQPFLARPELVPDERGGVVYHLTRPGESMPAGKIPAWIYVFDIDADSERTPNPLVVRKVIGATAEALNWYALTAAPRHAAAALLSDAGIYNILRRRLRAYWPDQAFGVVTQEPSP